MRFTWRTTGPPSFGTRQNRPNGVSEYRGGMPLKPHPMTQGASFSMARRQYAETKSWDWGGRSKRGPCMNGKGGSRGGSMYGRQGHGCAHTQPLVGESEYRSKVRLLAAAGASDRTARLKAQAIGKSSAGSKGKPMSFKAFDRNTVNRQRQRTRAGGSVAPKKKGAIANPHGTGGCC